VSPIIHAAVGWLVAQPLAKRRDRILVTVAAVAPDIDGLGLLISDELYENWHHRLAHGIAAAVVTLVVCAIVSRSVRGALLGVVAFHTHIAMDLAGSGPGWPILYFWPWSNTEWLPAWQWDLASWQNSTFGLAVILACLACAIPLGRTPVELFSPKADARVVEAIRSRRRGTTAS
jgi:hypothetical protein